MLTSSSVTLKYENTMKKMTLLTREFITDNVKVNNSASSYPIRTVASIIPVVSKNPSATLSTTPSKKA